jgi:NAD+ synthase
MKWKGLRKMLEIDLERAQKLIEGFICSCVSGASMKGAVLGLSGGLDSALVAGIASKALGPDNVLGLLLPFRQSSKDSIEHAKLVAEKFGVKTKIIDISNMVDGYHEEIDRFRLGNLLARLRMCVIFDQSMASKSIVLGTSNKTEMLLGYSTWYGDMAAGCYPIGDIYKTQVRALAKYIGVPDVIIEKAPSADLWPGQTDEGEIGNTYERLDQILDMLVDQRLPKEKIAQRGFSLSEVEAIELKMRKSQFKRVLPPVCKVTGRTIDQDFRYIRDWSVG